MIDRLISELYWQSDQIEVLIGYFIQSFVRRQMDTTRTGNTQFVLDRRNGDLIHRLVIKNLPASSDGSCVCSRASQHVDDDHSFHLFGTLSDRNKDGFLN